MMNMRDLMIVLWRYYQLPKQMMNGVLLTIAFTHHYHSLTLLEEGAVNRCLNTPVSSTHPVSNEVFVKRLLLAQVMIPGSWD
uniref:Uncharacterized protein n=1 Tax=Otarine gammaherpesvirus 4 TaxID=2801541 RepID=A0A889IWA1_9GAMA|nr:hypothetical protein [Otarine gammaherpesvirus 4]